MNPDEFNSILWEFYAKNARNNLPWRIPDQNGVFDPYKILVSEIMLQQTQVERVTPKYNDWLTVFPTIQSLAAAPLSAVLAQWIGLGYNRRAKYIHDTAKRIVSMGYFPRTQEELVTLPGVGPNTAGAIQAYAHNEPALFIETNIRTVFLYHFFYEQEQVSDRDIMAHIMSNIDTERPREWYWALMDYGTYIKQTLGNYAKNSKQHTKQSKFIGSKRQVRGEVIRLLAKNRQKTLKQFKETITDERLGVVLADLEQEGIITQKQGRFYLSD